ncbi:MAG: hypothetical protein HOI95_07625 [Chromatiales bacterium]|jgi:hypothetical protein|nr:hypothetical protein [Chromatiales bacterium]
MPSTWYILTKRGKVGPFPSRQLQQYIVLGRLNPDRVQVSHDGETWTAMHTVGAFTPGRINAIAGPPDTPARLRYLRDADERSGRARRADETSEDAAASERRRQGDERRAPEPEHVVSARERRPAPIEHGSIAPTKVWATAGAGLLAFAVILLLVTQLSDTAGFGVPRDCNAAPVPRVNWNGCQLLGAKLRGADLREATMVEANLSGVDLRRAQMNKADLSYARFTGGNLSGAKLTAATLFGTTLQRVNLQRAKLDRADLRSANFIGARIAGATFHGAQLGGALWIDGAQCAANSVGGCVRTQ